MKTSIIISSSSSSFFLVLLAAAALTLIIQTVDAESQQQQQQNDRSSLIETTCKHTQNYPLCLKTIQADPKSAAADDVEGLGLILIEAVRAKSKSAFSAATRLIRTQPKLAKPLRECADVYKAVIEADVPMAVQAIRGNPKFAENGMADAAVEADVCEAGFHGVAVSPMRAANNAVRDLAVVARAIIRNLL